MGQSADTAGGSSRAAVLTIFGIAMIIPVSTGVFLLTHGRDKPDVDLALTSPCGLLDPGTLSLMAPGGSVTATENGGSSTAVRHCTVDTTGRDIEVDVQADGKQFTGQWRADRCREIEADPSRVSSHVVCLSQRRDAGQSRIDSYTWVAGAYQVHVSYQRIPADQVPDDAVAAYDELVAKVVKALPASSG